MIERIGLKVAQLMDGERAHRLTIWALRNGLAKGNGIKIDPMLKTDVMGLRFPSPIGLAAGFDKNAEVPNEMLGFGLGFVEVGSITPKPQDGNPKPRLFRLKQDRAVINRMGFNNEGHDAALARLQVRDRRAGLVGVNIGANKDAEDRMADYEAGVRAFAGVADFFVANISSPNTPGLRGLQDKDQLQELLTRVMAARANPSTPVLLKIAPDLDDQAAEDIAAIVMASGIDGLIVSNTTIERPDSLQSALKGEQGGLSGKPLMGPSTALLSRIYKLTDGKLPLVGVGGVASAADAYAKIRAGASLVELYSALAFDGPRLITEITQGLAVLLRNDGFTSVARAVGADHK